MNCGGSKQVFAVMSLQFCVPYSHLNHLTLSLSLFLSLTLTHSSAERIRKFKTKKQTKQHIAKASYKNRMIMLKLWKNNFRNMFSLSFCPIN